MKNRTREILLLLMLSMLLPNTEEAWGVGFGSGFGVNGSFYFLDERSKPLTGPGLDFSWRLSPDLDLAVYTGKWNWAERGTFFENPLTAQRNFKVRLMSAELQYRVKINRRMRLYTGFGIARFETDLDYRNDQYSVHAVQSPFGFNLVTGMNYSLSDHWNLCLEGRLVQSVSEFHLSEMKKDFLLDLGGVILSLGFTWEQ